jgi:hypothetical protein
MTATWAVVCSKGRPDVMRACMQAIDGQVDGVVIVDNNDVHSESITDGLTLSLRWVVHMPGYPPNLSAMINAGVAECPVPGSAPWNLVLLNDDVTVPARWVESLAGPMRSTGAAAAYIDRLGRPVPSLMRTPPRDQSESMTCWACMLRGELDIRWDENLHWWYGDNDLDLRCRFDYGGVLAVPGLMPNHSHPSAQTFASVELSQQTRRDEAAFNAKWAGRL